MNRCLTEGRHSLAIKLAGIEGGIECAQLAPLLAALAIGSAGPDDFARLGPHIKSCLSCRARLRALRAGRVGCRAGGRIGTPARAPSRRLPRAA